MKLEKEDSIKIAVGVVIIILIVCGILLELNKVMTSLETDEDDYNQVGYSYSFYQDTESPDVWVLRFYAENSGYALVIVGDFVHPVEHKLSYHKGLNQIPLPPSEKRPLLATFYERL